jgi:ssDNA-binding Zn-finger/Zn-ribbon topoisomerase 1
MAKTEPMEPEAPETPEVPEDFEDPTEDLTFVTERDLRTEGAKEFGLNIKQAFVFAKILKNTKLKRYQNKEEVANRVKNIWSPEVLLYFTDVGNNIEDPAAILAKENWYTDEKKILYPKPESGLAEKYPNLKDGVHPEEIEALRKKKKGQAKRLAVLRTAFPETAKKIKRARKNRPTVINAFPPRKLESGDYDFSEFDKLKDKEVVSWINGLKYNKKHYPKGEWTEAMEATLQYLINKRYLTNKKYLKSLNKDKKGL